MNLQRISPTVTLALSVVFLFWKLRAEIKNMALESKSSKRKILSFRMEPNYSSMAMASKEQELPILIDGQRCGVQVTSTDTLSNVRAKILEDFDIDMLPEQSQDFFISVGNMRLSSKQETKKLAWDVIAENEIISLHSKGSATAKRAATGSRRERPTKQARTREDLSVSQTMEDLDASDSEEEWEPESSEIPRKPSLLREENLSLSQSEISHVKFDKAVKQSCDLLKRACEFLQHPDTAVFCSETRRTEVVEEIQAGLRDTAAPDTIIGVLGSTGVGKSSVLNALLGEASILPTS